MKATETAGDSSVFELKGSVLTVMVLYVKDTDPDALYPLLKKKIGPARSFFNNAPILVDLKYVDEAAQLRLDFLVLTTFLRGLGLIPVGVRAASDVVARRVIDAGLGVLPPAKQEKHIPPEEVIPEEEALVKTAEVPAAPVEPEAAPAEAPVPEPLVEVVPTMVITQPVRSGQQIVAQDGDLVIIAPVNAGAEVIAAGNIHVYGTLSGRAMAGVHGNKDARIFCLQCNAELLAVGDAYIVNDALPENVQNHCVMISRGGKRLHVDVLGTFDTSH